MSEKTMLRLVILQESELRTAARLLDQMIEIQKRDHSEDEFGDAAHQALNACLVALHGVADTDNLLMLSAVDLTKRGAEPATEGPQ